MFTLKRNESGRGVEYMGDGDEEIKVLSVFPVGARENDDQTGLVSPGFCATEVVCFALIVAGSETFAVRWSDILHDIESGWLSYSE